MAIIPRTSNQMSHEMRKALGLEIIKEEINNKRYEYLLKQNEEREERAIRFHNGSEIRFPVPSEYLHRYAVVELPELDAEAYRMMIQRVRDNTRVHIMGNFNV